MSIETILVGTFSEYESFNIAALTLAKEIFYSLFLIIAVKKFTVFADAFEGPRIQRLQ